MKEYINKDGTPFSKEQFIDKIKNDKEFCDKFGNLGPIYGKQWRKWERNATRNEKIVEPGVYTKQIDQIANLIRDLKTNPDSRRLMVSAWNVGELDQMTLPPCHYGFQVYTRELSLEERNDLLNKKTNRNHKRENCFSDEEFERETLQDCKAFNIPTRAISLMWNQRSVDTFLGLPFNIASYGLLLEIIAECVNMVPDELIGNLGDTHLYLNHIEQAKEQIGRQPYSLPRFNINTEWWPTESGECGVGPIDAMAVVNGFANENFCKCLMEQDFQLGGYQSHPTIKAPLSN